MIETTLRIKKNWRRIASFDNDDRSVSRICEHYLLEKELAARLLQSSAEERTTLYTQLYDELFTKLPDHPQHTRSRDEGQDVQQQVDFLKKLVPKGARFAEIGAGDCRLSLGLAGHCHSVAALDSANACKSQAKDR